MRPAIQPGIRVVRGPNWIWQNQDNGEGHVGTVCEIGRSGSTHSPENTVVVNWDSGHRTNYRVGYQNQYDLIIVDNAQVGVRHSNVVCDGCSKPGIAGIVFKCAQCSNYHLCANCYGADLHDTDHTFIRYTTPTSLGVRLPPRKNSKRIQLKGIFIGAKVVRGPDWEWGQQDGGEGKTGRVMEIRGWDNESCRSVANVSWVTGSTNVYRLGHKGNVDLKCTFPSIGGYYYKDHMPVLGQPEEQQPVVPTGKPSFSVGDRVKVCLDVDALMKLQQGHGGWNPRMVEQLPKLGAVHRITEKGDIRVQYDNCPNRWTFHPAALVKVISFRVGDLVTIINDANKVQQLQKGHGEWIDLMRYALGKRCKVIKVYSDGDLRIQQLDDGFEWTLNPKCVHLERSPLATAAERSNSMMDLSHRRIDHVMTPLSGLSGTSVADKLVREAAQGHLDFVKQYLDAHPEQVNVMSGGKACVQVAAHQGYVDLVKYLIAKGANVNVVDKEGDSALHYAAFGNQPETMRVLLQNGADINFLNSSHCSALHICAHKKTPHCVRELLQFGADVNIQDSYGDTALHDAIGKENSEVVELLCNAPNLDFFIKNNRGFNVLHHASLKGNVVAAKRILQLARQLVNVKKDDGFAALHLAALNGHARVVETLVMEGLAEIDIRNNRRQTPFLLAVSQGHASVIERLVSLRCDIMARDEDGDNAMHLCVIKKTNLQQAAEPSGEDSPKIRSIYDNLSHILDDRLMYSILCYLSSCGCRVEQNNKGTNIFDWITNKDMKQLILRYQCQIGATASSSSTTNEAATLNSAGEMENNIQALNLNTDNDGATAGASATVVHSNNAADIITDVLQPNTFNQIPTPHSSTPTHHVENSTDEPAGAKKLNSDRQAQTNPIVGSNNMLDAQQYVHMTPIPSTSGVTQLTGNRKVSRNRIEGAAAPKASPKATPPPPPPTNVPFHIGPQECIVCDEKLQLIKFEPCQHQISCEECGLRMKKCLRCGVQIERRIAAGGRVVFSSDQTRVPSADRLRYLENKIQEYEETHYCSICMERTRDVAFLCGHGACSRCAETLRTCHMCRKTILRKINLY
ncbi:PREDICTED: E3 ubiquitin-protein ligase MIB2 [Bactrocera latifrons]|uniref:RING-type E3 ubiquitin transferase n=3 Tax=Bactrocera latifrons TaxID=174628 RepID=A0A0K8VAK2_BACLA|nr:PREDICTED: E3 ubiquitin-protein ligase MIB2 [Bactrocera latifrons]XP_018803463.1 PREDICTED: E3 ubiquitin-protein ligase MIB2 [Bactrocera latifrons]XP_018803464.1 PREDICTED: E3 ubiquitin-protein ligase MIB2 [Bactrocera latifrons]XP_018803465.1 PREDICTED: E3 ubiquitin-protein ligase MIB2 [Bactrocera latifrons]